MTLLLSPSALDSRRAIAQGPLAPLASSLAADLRDVMARPLYVPEQKALLSRDGGRCPRDGAMLDFDPFSPYAHYCPACGQVYAGRLHHRFWIYWYQLWLAERAVHAALLGRLGVVENATGFATSILSALGDAYPKYPNVDNVLGPTRPFFSTYLESIWLLQLCVALDLIGDNHETDRFRDVVIEPSRTLIASFDEGMSNRQAWNNAALIAADLKLGRGDAAESTIWAESGLVTHLGEAMLADGTWYEGENYHLFAHRGLWYGVSMAASMGAELPPELIARFDRGFATPFLTSLPDLTFPSRRDSQYAISLRQWRFAEMCELGLARGEDRLLGGMLGQLYDGSAPTGDAGRSRSSAEAERNLPPTRLTRADLGWKSLLMARPTLEALPDTPLPSVLLEAQGIGVLRRDAGQVYAALDYGQSGGGHGHPDRLNVLLMSGESRVLDDVGTGSYVDPSLHWYRSTLAHNAPLFDGRSQPRVDGNLIAFEDRGAAGWISASARFGAGEATRTIVAMPDYLVDELEFVANGARILDLPLHVDATLIMPPARSEHASLEGTDGLEDGFRFLRDTVRLATIESGELCRFSVRAGTVTVDCCLGADVPLEIWKTTAPGAPGTPVASFIVVRSRAEAGRIRAVWTWEGAIRNASLFPDVVVATAESVQTHTRVPHGWNVAIQVGAAKSSIDLEGLVPAELPGAVEGSEDEDLRAVVLREGRPLVLRLGEESYRRSESSWMEAGSPAATVTLTNDHGALALSVETSNAHRSFAKPGVMNPFDNESADINGAGLQLYLQSDRGRSGYVIVPILDSDVLHVRPIEGWGSSLPMDGRWTRIDGGYRIDLRIAEPAGRGEQVVELDLIVNEMPAGRARRRGQLVLSGGAGEFVYLRGDRHDPARLIPFVLTDA